jgi:cell division protein FtsQ
MKEQVVASRGVRRSASQTKGFVQRPARRNGAAARQGSFSPRALFAYVPKALKVVLGIVAVITLIVGYRVAASASLFQVRAIDVTGTTRTSADEIAGLTRRAIVRTGVWRADLDAISRELGRLPGVRRAVVSRVLPDGLRVRITERVPVAVVRTAAGHFVWVDEDGVALGEMKPDDHMPAFFIRGWNEDGTEEARAENIERVKKYQEAAREWDAAGLSERVSEVTLIDVRDVRAQLAGPDSQIEVRLGAQELGSRLKTALEGLDMYKQSARGSAITFVDVQTGRVVIGFSSGSKVSTETSSATDSVPDASAASSPSITRASDKQNKSPKPANDDVRRNDRREDGKKDPADRNPTLRFR